MPRNRDENEGCLTTEQIQESAYRAFTKFEFRIGRSQPDWLDLEDDVKSSWCAMVNNLLVKFDDEDASHGVADLADEAHHRFAEGITGEIPADFERWDDLSEVQRQQWRHLIRHIVNLLAYDTEDTQGKKVQDHEDVIDDFLRAKLEELGFEQTSPDQPKEPTHGRQDEGAIFDAAAERFDPETDPPWSPPDEPEPDGCGPRGPQPAPRPPATQFYGQITVGGFGS